MAMAVGLDALFEPGVEGVGKDLGPAFEIEGGLVLVGGELDGESGHGMSVA